MAVLGSTHSTDGKQPTGGEGRLSTRRQGLGPLSLVLLHGADPRWSPGWEIKKDPYTPLSVPNDTFAIYQGQYFWDGSPRRRAMPCRSLS